MPATVDVFDSKISDVVRGKHKSLVDDCPPLSASTSVSTSSTPKTTQPSQHSAPSVLFPLISIHVQLLPSCCICFVDYVTFATVLLLMALPNSGPHAGSGVVKIDPLCFLAGYRKRRLNQALSIFVLVYFLPARRIHKCGLCYGNMAGWLAACHMPVLYQNG